MSAAGPSPAGAGAGHVSWNSGLEDRGWDRRRGLLGSAAAAILAIGPAGLRRNRATGIPRPTAPLEGDLAAGIAAGRGPRSAASRRLPQRLDLCYRLEGSFKPMTAVGDARGVTCGMMRRLENGHWTA
jgi:hypothetical protein